MKLQAAREKIAAEREQTNADLAKTRMELNATAQETQHRTQQSAMQLEAADLKLKAAKEESKTGEKIDKVSSDMGKRMDKAEMHAAQMGQALSVILGGMAQKKKASGFKLKKKDGKTVSVVVEHSDGSEEELPVKAA